MRTSPPAGPQESYQPMANRPLRHPPIESIQVVDVLHALSDPVRLAIVKELRRVRGGLNCVEMMGRVDATLPKSTCSQHFQVLRDAGLVHSERKGVELWNRLRLKELESRFPGLLRSIFRALEKENETV